MLGELISDLRFGLRLVARTPGFTVVALIAMALGIGANTAIFSLVDGVLLKPLPYPEAERAVLLQANNLHQGWSSFSISSLDFWDWRDLNRSMQLLPQTGEPVSHTDQVTSVDPVKSLMVE